MRKFWPELRKYLFEVLAIITGITLSFWFDEWRDRRKDRHDSIELLSSIAGNLKTDTAMLRLTMDYQHNMIAGERHILSSDSMRADSMVSGMLAFQTYPTFRTNNVAYLTMVQTGQSRVLANKKLLTQINDLYQVQYKMIDEWTDIERRTVLEKNISFMNAHTPYVKLYNYAALMKDARFHAMMENDEFRNLMSTDFGFKSAMNLFYKNAQDSVNSLLKSVDMEISKLQ